MFRKLLIALAASIAMVAMVDSAHAAIEVNSADQAQLESIKGIGPATAKSILDERKKGAFKDWQDFAKRVKGVGDKNSAKFSDAGLTVNGQANAAGTAPLAKGGSMSKDTSASGMSRVSTPTSDKGGAMSKPATGAPK